MGTLKVLSGESKKEEKRLNKVLKDLFNLCSDEGKLKKCEAKAKELKEELKEALALNGIYDTSEYNKVKSPDEQYLSTFSFSSRRGQIDMDIVRDKYTKEEYEIFKKIIGDESVYKQGEPYFSFKFRKL